MALTQEQQQAVRNKLQEIRSGNAGSVSGVNPVQQKLQEIRRRKTSQPITPELKQDRQARVAEMSKKIQTEELPKYQQFISGFGKEVIKRPFTISSMGERLLGTLGKTLLPKSAEKAIGIEDAPTLFSKGGRLTGGEALLQQPKIKDLTTQRTGTEKAGAIAEQVVEFLAPGATSLKLGRAAKVGAEGLGAGKFLGGAAKLGTIAGTEGLLGLGQAGLQSGKIGEEEKDIAKLSLLMPPALVAGSKLLKPLVKPFMPAAKKAADAVKKAVDKSLKPGVARVKTAAQKNRFYGQAMDAFATINKYPTAFKNEAGNLEFRNPRTLSEMFDALGQVKSKIFNTYDNIAKEAGEQIKFSAEEALNKLRRVAQDRGYSPEIRKYAAKQLSAISELDGASLDIIQRRIREYNDSLAGFYSGRVDRAKARVDASVAKLLRDKLDEIINNVTGKNYQFYKNEYSALKAIEDDLARQAAIQARKSRAGFFDLTDVFTGGDLIAGALSANPVLLLQGLAGRSIKKFLKEMNNPDRFIQKAFQEIKKLPVPQPPQVQKTTPLLMAPKAGTPQKSINTPINLPSRTPSTVESQEMQRIQGLLNTQKKNSLMTRPKLIQEAKKYKTADEFIRSQGDEMIHFTSPETQKIINKEGFNINRFGKGMGTTPTEPVGLYLHPSKKDAKNYLKNNFDVGEEIPEHIAGEVVVRGKLKNPYIINNIEDWTSIVRKADKSPGKTKGEQITNYLKSQGYDGIDDSDGLMSFAINGAEEPALVFFNPEQVKTKSQLKQIWKEANKSS